jgi:hypothetical protein
MGTLTLAGQHHERQSGATQWGLTPQVNARRRLVADVQDTGSTPVRSTKAWMPRYSGRGITTPCFDGPVPVSTECTVIATCVQVDDYLNSVKPINAETNVKAMAAHA